MSSYNGDSGERTLLPREERYATISLNRKELGLTRADLHVLHVLVALSMSRLYIVRKPSYIANKFGINEAEMSRTIQRLLRLDYIRRGEYKKCSFIIVDPMLINQGDAKRRAFKIKLWESAIKLNCKKSHSSGD